MVSAVPNVPATPASIKITVPSIKTAGPEIVINKDQTVPIERLAKLIMEDIGGQEIISIARTDLVSSNVASKSLISNIAYINGKYSPLNIFTVAGGINSYFGNFPKDLNSFVPEDGTGENGEKIYLDSDGNMVIDVFYLGTNDVVDVQLLNLGIIESDII